MTMLAILFGFAVSALLVFLLNWVVINPWRRTSGEHWSVRACALYPARISSGLHFIYVPLLVGVMGLLIWPENHAYAALLIAVYAGGLAGAYPMRREVFPDVSFVSFLIGTPLILYLLLGLVTATVVCACVMPPMLGMGFWVVTGIYTVFQTVVLAKLDIWLLRQLNILLPAPLRLQAIVDEISARMSTPVSRTLVMPSPSANALAMPPQGWLIFTDRLLANLPDGEIKAICAHEVEHLHQKKTFQRRSIVLRLGLASLIFVKPLFHYFGLAGAAMPFVVFLVAGFSTRKIGRQMETEADEAGMKTSENPAVYARALEHIYRINQMPAILPKKRHRAHPDLYDRMTQAGVTPDFPKPLPPKKFSKFSFIVLICLGVMLGVLLGVLDDSRNNF